MTRLTASAALGFLLFAGCPSKDGPGVKLSLISEGPSLAGKWEESGGAIVTIEKVGPRLLVTSHVDYDGEVFVITNHDVEDGHFSYTYNVPSTGYVVTQVVTEINGDQATLSWRNEYDNGTDTMVRVR